MNGDGVSRAVSVQKDDILNTCCNIDCCMSSANILTLNG